MTFRNGAPTFLISLEAETLSMMKYKHPTVYQILATNPLTI